MSDAVAERTMLPTIYEWQAGAMEKAAHAVAHWVDTTPEDKLAWTPEADGSEHKGRSIYDQIHECAQVNRRMANVLRGSENGPWVEDYPYQSSREAQDDLKASAKDLAAVVRGLDEGALAREFTTAMGPMSGDSVISLAMMNMFYHGGQINLIQMLLGDGEFHFPGKE